MTNQGSWHATHNRGFIQWAGFTFGEATSFFDFYSIGALSYLRPTRRPRRPVAAGWWLATRPSSAMASPARLAVEEPRTDANHRRSGSDSSTARHYRCCNCPPCGGWPGGYGGFQAPDIVGNLRVDQAWGSAQVMAAAHQVNATYYAWLGRVSRAWRAGHPGDKWGWAVGGGLKLNAPMIGQGDYFMAEVNYTEGALGYIFTLQRLQPVQAQW